MLKHFALTLAIVFATTSLCEAGGGNSKSKGSIKVSNTSRTKIALVIVNPSKDAMEAETLKEFLDAGGRVVEPGHSTEFKNLKAGKYLVATALVQEDTEPGDVNFDTANVTVRKGKTSSISLRD